MTAAENLFATAAANANIVPASANTMSTLTATAVLVKLAPMKNKEIILTRFHSTSLLLHLQIIKNIYACVTNSGSGVGNKEKYGGNGSQVCIKRRCDSGECKQAVSVMKNNMIVVSYVRLSITVVKKR